MIYQQQSFSLRENLADALHPLAHPSYLINCSLSGVRRRTFGYTSQTYDSGFVVTSRSMHTDLSNLLSRQARLCGLLLCSVLSNANISRLISRLWKCSQGDVLSLPESCRCITAHQLGRVSQSILGPYRKPILPLLSSSGFDGPCESLTPNLFGGSALSESAPNVAKVILGAFRVAYDVFMFDEA